MIRFDAHRQVVVLDLVDLEHCGFDCQEYRGELHLAGIEAPAARWPIALLVNFLGGAVVTAETTPETRDQIAQADVRFRALCQACGCEESRVQQRPRTYFILHPDEQTATVITASGSPRIIRLKEGRWWCDCPHYRGLERQGRPASCGHVRLADTADVRMEV